VQLLLQAKRQNPTKFAGHFDEDDEDIYEATEEEKQSQLMAYTLTKWQHCLAYMSLLLSFHIVQICDKIHVTCSKDNERLDQQ